MSVVIAIAVIAVILIGCAIIASAVIGDIHPLFAILGIAIAVAPFVVRAFV